VSPLCGAAQSVVGRKPPRSRARRIAQRPQCSRERTRVCRALGLQLRMPGKRSRIRGSCAHASTKGWFAATSVTRHKTPALIRQTKTRGRKSTRKPRSRAFRLRDPAARSVVGLGPTYPHPPQRFDRRLRLLSLPVLRTDLSEQSLSRMDSTSPLSRLMARRRNRIRALHTHNLRTAQVRSARASKPDPVGLDTLDN